MTTTERDLHHVIDQRIAQRGATAYLERNRLPDPVLPAPGTWEHSVMEAHERKRRERTAAVKVEAERQRREREDATERQRQAREAAAENARHELTKLEPQIGKAHATVAKLAPRVEEAQAVLDHAAELEREANR